jgi:hypothetical protein
MFADCDGRADKQSISSDNDGTYTSYMSPFTAGMLGLPCQPCSRSRQMKFGDYSLVIAILGVLDGTFASLAIPHLLIPGFLHFTSVGTVLGR